MSPVLTYMGNNCDVQFPYLRFSAFTKMSNMTCDGYGIYSSLLNAAGACISDSSCQGVLENYSFDFGYSKFALAFQLCNKSTIHRDTTKSRYNDQRSNFVYNIKGT